MSYTPRHRRSMIRRRLASGVATAATLGIIMASSASPATALASKTLEAKDGASIGRCALSITNANYAAGIVKIKVTASVRPAGAFGIVNNAHVFVRCDVYLDGFAGLVANLQREADGAYILAQGTFVVPLTSDYELCTQVITTLRSGPTVSGANCT